MKTKIGLKSKWIINQLRTRITQRPDFIEIYLANKDLENNIDQIEESLRFLREKHKNISVTMHQPEKYKDKFLNLTSENPNTTTNTYECLDILNSLAVKYKLGGIIVHPYWSEDDDYINDDASNAEKVERLISSLNNILKYKNNIFLENEISGCFSSLQDILNVLDKTKFKLVLDFCHLRVACGSDINFKRAINELKSHIGYCHLSDTKGDHDDALELGEGVIDWVELSKHIKVALIEVEERDYINIPKMLNSYNYFKKICYQNTISKTK